MTYTEFIEWMPKLTSINKNLTSAATSALNKASMSKTPLQGGSFKQKTAMNGNKSLSPDCPPTRPVRSNSSSLPTEQMLKEEEERDLRAAFSVFDTDNNGYISREELKLGLIFLNEPEEQVDWILKQADIDQDGKISVEDFLVILSSTKT